MSEEQREILTETAAAAFLTVSPRTLQRWRAVGFGPPFLRYSARAIRYRLVDLRAWQEATAVAVPGAACGPR
jgi:hypothetical protein